MSNTTNENNNINEEELKAAEAEKASVSDEASEPAQAEETSVSSADVSTASSAEQDKKKKQPSGKGKRLRHGALSVVFTVIFVAAVVLINVIFNMVLDRFDISADLSDKAYYTIEDSTAEYLAGVDDSVSIIVTAEETAFENTYEYYKQVSEIAKRFANSNPRFSIQYLDLDENPTFYSKYGQTLTMGSIIVESASTGRFVVITQEEYLSPKYYFNNPTTGESSEVSYEEYYYYSQMGYGSVEYYAAAEQCLLAAVMNVTNVDPVRVAFVLGYGAESAPEAFSDLLKNNAYIVETVDITTVEKIDADIDYLILFAPIYDYSNDDISKIDMWLDNNGRYDKNMMYVPSAQEDVLPNLNEYLEEWGLSLGSGYVYQKSPEYGYEASPTYQVFQLKESEYSKDIDVSTKVTQADRMKPINILFDEYSIYVTTPIISSYSGAVIAPFDMGDWDSSSADETGEYVVAAESRKTFYEQLDPHVSRVFVISGQYFMDETFLSAPSLNNADIVLNIFGVSSGNELEVSVTPKAFGVTTYEITGSQKNFAGIVFAIVIPVVVIITGIVVIIRRKRR